jgi:protein-tyrosine-phosphatase
MTDTATPAPFKLLFVCVENSNRSQMSQAFAKILGGDKVESYSAGSKPSGIVNPKVRERERERRERGRAGGRAGGKGVRVGEGKEYTPIIHLCSLNIQQ